MAQLQPLITVEQATELQGLLHGIIPAHADLDLVQDFSFERPLNLAPLVAVRTDTETSYYVADYTTLNNLHRTRQISVEAYDEASAISTRIEQHMPALLASIQVRAVANKFREYAPHVRYGAAIYSRYPRDKGIVADFGYSRASAKLLTPIAKKSVLPSGPYHPTDTLLNLTRLFHRNVSSQL